MSLKKQLLRILEKLSKSGLTEGFYLTGGTALMLKYNHRVSEDLDFFTVPELSEENFPHTRLLSGLSNMGSIVEHTKGTLIAMVDGIKVSFFSYPYSLLNPLEQLRAIQSDQGPAAVLAASDEDIACTKAIAIAQRGCKKDFFDLYFLMRLHSWKIDDILDMCLHKYSLDPDYISFVLKALTYFSDAEQEIVYIEENKELSRTTWEQIKSFFQQQVKSKFSDK